VLKRPTGGYTGFPQNTDKTRVADPRYTYKFKYKYDDKGNRIEELWYRNDGSLESRYVSVYDEKGHKVEYQRYTAEGELFARRVRIDDDKGNMIEERLSWPRTPITEKMSFTYEFDRQGNWVKKKSMRWVTKGGKSYYEPIFVTYREIEYF